MPILFAEVDIGLFRGLSDVCIGFKPLDVLPYYFSISYFDNKFLNIFLTILCFPFDIFMILSWILYQLFCILFIIGFILTAIMISIIFSLTGLIFLIFYFIEVKQSDKEFERNKNNNQNQNQIDIENQIDNDFILK